LQIKEYKVNIPYFTLLPLESQAVFSRIQEKKSSFSLIKSPEGLQDGGKTIPYIVTEEPDKETLPCF